MPDYDSLAPYYDTEWRNLVQDIPFLIEEARKTGGPILELACGTGRVTLPLAQEGYEVWGIDNSDQMLKIFENKLKKENPDVSGRIHISNRGMQNFDLGKKFKLIIIPFNSFLLLTDRKELDSCLECCRNHLDEGGVLIVDVFAPNFELCAVKEPKIQFLQHFYVPHIKKVVVQWEYAKRDMGNQIIDIDFLYEEYDQNGDVTKKTHSIKMSLIFRFELEYLLEKNGFAVEDTFGDYDRSEFSQTSPQIICISTKKM